MTATTTPGEGETALVQRLKRGDEAAFEEVVRAYAPRLVPVAQRYVGDRAAAEDCVQDAFLAAFRALDTFEGRSGLGTWLHRITVNAALQALRKRGGREEVDIEPLLPSFDADGFLEGPRTTAAPDAEDLLAREDVRREVKAAIDRLPEPYRNVLLLRDIEGLSIKETAAMLELSESNAKVRLHRARHALKALLEPLFVEGAL